MPKTASKYQPGGNYTKLMKEMKCSIDTQLYLGVLNPISLGLLVKGILSFSSRVLKKKGMIYNECIFVGFKATLFQMKLLSDGVYIPMAFDRFSLVEEIHELVQLPSVVEAFCLVKVLNEKLILATAY